MASEGVTTSLNLDFRCRAKEGVIQGNIRFSAFFPADDINPHDVGHPRSVGVVVTPLVSGIGQLFERSDSSASLFLFFCLSSMSPPFAAETETPHITRPRSPGTSGRVTAGAGLHQPCNG